MKRTIATFLSVAIMLGACSGPSGKILADSDEDLVGHRVAGAATFDRLIVGADRLLQDAAAARGGNAAMRIVCLAVDNQSAEELGDWQEQIYSLLSSSINRAQRFEMISRRFVSAALVDTRLRPDQLFLPRHQRTFAAVLEREGMPVDAFLFPKLTSGTTDSAGVSQRNYGFELELVDVKTGTTKQFTTRLRKEYRG